MFNFDNFASVQDGINIAVTEKRAVFMKFTGCCADALREITEVKGCSVSHFAEQTSLFIEPPVVNRNCCRQDMNRQFL
jgi:hypothetical protein